MLKLVRPVGLILLSGALCSTMNINAAGNKPANSTSISQQKTKLTGNVIDVFGPVTGASVLIKGTTNGTITDLDGNFTLDVANGEIVVISFIGYVTQEIVIKGQTTLAINLAEDAQALDELVVTALGMKRSEKALGYAVTELKGDDLNTNAINPISSLQGKVAGVEISGSDGGMFGANKIQIRGASTLSGNNQPIYVIDGVILSNDISGTSNSDYDGEASDYGNQLKNLNPDDFQSISVLKGAAATALYGSRGLNGAVVITTKGGGSFSGFGVSVSQTFGMDHVYATSDRQMEYGPGNYNGNVTYGEQMPGGGFNKWDSNQFSLNENGVPTVIGTTNRHWGPRYDGRTIENYDGTMTSYSPIEDNYKDAYQLGLNSNTNVAVRGGNEKTNFYTSLSYKKAKGVVENNDFERYSMLLKGSHKISDRVDVNASFNFANSSPRNAQRNLGDGYADGSYSTMYDTNYFKDKYRGDNHGGIANSAYGDKYANVPNKNLWFNIDNRNLVRNETVIRPTVEVNVKIFDWMRFRAEGNMNYYFENYENEELGGGYANDGGYYKMAQNSKTQTTFAGTFTFDKAVKDFNIGGFLRGEYYTTSAASQYSETSGGLIVPGQYFLSNSKDPIKTDAYVHGTKRMLAVVAAANISWKNQVFLDITARNDWSSSLVYTNGTGNHSYFYPSIGGSWLINETYDLPDWITLAKVRGSWAQVGNDADPYSIYSGYSVGSLLQGGGNIYVNGIPEKLYDADLKPERKNAWEVGLDWRVFSGRIGLDVTYYKENTKDQIMNIAIPYESGVDEQLINAGNIQNSGVEIALNTIPFQNKDWTWNVDFTYTKNDNKIISLHPNVADYIKLVGDPSGANYRVGSVAKVGGSYGLLMSDSAPKRNEDGEIILSWRDDMRASYATRSGEVEEIGSLTPDFLGSLSTGVKWKDLSINIGLDMRMGGLVASYSNKYGTAYGTTATSLKYRDAENGGLAWTSNYQDSHGMEFNDGVIPEGVFADGTIVTGVDGKPHKVGGQSYASLVEAGILEPQHASTYHYWNNAWGTGTVNDSWVNELNYIAIRDITVHYNLPKSFTSKIGAKRMGVAFSGRNLGYLYNSLPNNLNPESIRGNNSAEFRERSNSPYTASYMFTINMDF